MDSIDDETPAPSTLCLVVADAEVERAVEKGIGPAVNLRVFARAGLLDDKHELSAHGHAIVEASKGGEAVLVEWALDEAPAINTLCYHVRAHAEGPVIGLVHTANEIPACLAAGADDAHEGIPPWAFIQARVLAYRRLVDAVVRRALPLPEPLEDRQFGPLRLDARAHRFYVGDTEVVLTPREFALVRYLIGHARELRTRQQILDEVWGITFDTGTNMVDVYMFFLRRKLEAHGLKGMIETVRGQGYRLVEATAA